jgi:serine/threonine-protein kinase
MDDLAENMVVADRFRLVRMIGKGGMGSVWQAQHLGLDIPCAVKFIEGALANVAEAHARFEREAKAAAQLRSPNVVQIFDHGVWEGRPYIAMELLEGEDLGKRLAKSGGRLAPPDVNFVVQQVCRALSRAHQAGVVHRDLKPDNIFIVKDDDRDIVKILDFGVAKSAAALDGSNTKTGAMLGTPYYMSPEQAQGIKSVDSRSDLWSLAVIVFQALTGRLPFESEALGDLLVKIIVSPVPVPSSYGVSLPPGFDNWWVKAADRNPENRFVSAKAFAESLTIALGQSSMTEVTERVRLQRSERPGASTALMANGPDMRAYVPNTPQPGVHTAAFANTPQPMHAPPVQQGGPPMGPPPGSYPGYGPGSAQATTGNPVAATYSGLEGASAPKKSPVAIFAGLGLLLLIGVGLGGVALMKGRAAGSGSDPATSKSNVAVVSASAIAPEAASAALPSKTAESPVPAVDSAAPLNVAASASASAVAATPIVQHHPAAPGANHPQTAKPVAAAPVVATAAAASAKPSGPKPFNLGF